MKQNVNSTAAVLIILLAVGIFFVVFNKPAAPGPADVQKPLPFEPPVEASKTNDVRKGLRPLGILAVFPPPMADRSGGVRVAAVIPNSPAQKAGIRPGDLISKFNGKRMTNPDALIYMLAIAKQDKTYPAEIVRAGKTQTVSVSGVVPLSPEELGFQLPASDGSSPAPPGK